MRNEDRTERLGRLIQQVMGSLHPADPEQLAGPELTMPQFRTLLLLNQGAARMSDLAAFLRCNLSSATSMVERLEAKNLVARTHATTDRRVVTASLTPEGRDEVARFWRINLRKIEWLAGVLTPSEFDQVIAGFETLAAAAERRRQSPAESPTE